MEKPHKIMFSVVAVLLYWLAASGFSEGLGQSTHIDQGIDSPGSQIFLIQEIPFVSGFAVKENIGFWSAGSAVPGTSKQSQVYKAVLGEKEVQVARSFAQYIEEIHNHPVRIRKSDMLFPFHYFFETARV